MEVLLKYLLLLVFQLIHLFHSLLLLLNYLERSFKLLLQFVHLSLQLCVALSEFLVLHLELLDRV